MAAGTTQGRLALRSAALVCALLAFAPRAAAQDPAVAPPTELSPDGRTVSGAGKVFQAGQVADLDPAGQSVTVQGSGYDENKGVYVTFCVIPPPDHLPTPCGGGEDRSGTSGASGWISSNPPDYAAGLTTAYGPGGTFSVTLSVEPVINADVDCRIVRCALVTRNDHTRTSDRSQDMLLPVSFREPGSPVPPTSNPPTSLPPPTTATTQPDPAAEPPDTSLAADGRSVSDGARTLSLSRVNGLDPDGAELTVSGRGFSGAQGLYLALCRIPEEPGLAPGPCTGGGQASRWISSDPPDYGRDQVEPFEGGGSFEVGLTVPARIDGETDCRQVTCAITTRSDDTAANDRRNDLLVPVTFADDSGASSSSTSAQATDSGAAGRGADDGGGGDSNMAVAALSGSGLLGAGAAVALVVRARRRSAGAAPAEDLS